MELHIYKNPEELSHAMAEWVTTYIEATLESKGRFTWVVTGGNSPRELYQLLAHPPYKDRINWQQLHIFWGDERVVPYNDERNNARMTFEMMLNEVPVIASQVHMMITDVDPSISAREYENLLKEYFSTTDGTFDLVLNGMGDDGHTLSLFPHTPVIHEQLNWVKSLYLDSQKMYRITLTPPVVNKAACVAFLSFGNNKASALKAVLEGEYNPDEYPSQIIRPQSKELHWFVDEAAAQLLKNKSRER